MPDFDRDRIELLLLKNLDVSRAPKSLAKIKRMTKLEIEGLAASAGIDVEAETAEVRRPSCHGYVHGYTFESEEERLLFDRAICNPAFEGSYEFDYTVSALGLDVKRVVRVEYKHTPDWEFFDLELGELAKGWPRSVWNVGVLVPGSTSRSSDGVAPQAECKSIWSDEVGTIFGEIEDLVYDEIDQRCRVEDAERRRKHLKR